MDDNCSSYFCVVCFLGPIFVKFVFLVLFLCSLFFLSKGLLVTLYIHCVNLSVSSFGAKHELVPCLEFI